jgi:hypothetical protein
MSRRASDAPKPCGKRRLSQSKAQGVVKKARRSRQEHRKECRVYFSPGCRCWHTASTPFLSFAERYPSQAA